MAQNSNQYFPQLPSFGSGGTAGGGSRQPWDLSGGNTDWKSMMTQWGASPTYVPGVSVPPSGGGGSTWQTQSMPGGGTLQQYGPGGGLIPISDQYYGEQSMYPQFSNEFASWLQGQIGQGATPFNLQTMLPTGGMTQPGQLSAGMNPLLQQLMKFYGGGGTNMPGGNTLSTIANEGISALPEWQSMIDAQQQNIQQNQANLKEQFGMMGGLAGTPYGNAMSNYMQQTTKDQNALLGQLQQQNILQGQIPVAEMLLGGAGQMGQYGQQLDQQAIQNMYNEFIRTQPEYNPLLSQMFGLATTFPPTLSKTTGMGAMGGLLGNLGGLLSLGMDSGGFLGSLAGLGGMFAGI